MKRTRAKPIFVDLAPKVRAELDALVAREREADPGATMAAVVRRAIVREIARAERES